MQFIVCQLYINKTAKIFYSSVIPFSASFDLIKVSNYIYHTHIFIPMILTTIEKLKIN